MGRQNGAKIDPKTRSKFKSEKDASWERLGSILVRFGGRPGAMFIDFLLFFFYYFVKIDVFEAKRPPRAIRERKRAKKGAKREAK